MTVREAVKVMGNAEIHLVWNGCTIPFETDNVLMLDAYGSYKVQRIGAGYCRKTNNGDCCFEIDIAMQPIKEVCTSKNCRFGSFAYPRRNNMAAF